MHGVARYGDATLMQTLAPGPAAQLESVTIDGAAKRFFLQHPLGTLNDLTFTGAHDRLKAAMDDLKTFVQQASGGGGAPGLLAMAAEEDSFRLVLDMEDAHDSGVSGFADAALMALGQNDVPAKVVLDPAESSDPIFWATMAAEPNLPAGLVDAVKPFYS